MVSVLAYNTLTIRVRIPLKPTVYFCMIVFEKNENKQKMAWVGPLFKKKLKTLPNLVALVVNTKSN